jgi:hypothetical protein
MPATTYEQNLLQNFRFKGGTYTPPDTWYLALMTTAPQADGSGTECADANYERQAITWGTVASGAAPSGADIVFGGAGGFAASYTVHYFALFDADTGGNMRARSTTDINVAVAANQQFKVASGDLTDTLA